MRNRKRTKRWLLAGALAGVTAGCTVSPQLEATSRTLQGAPRDRARSYDACRAAAADRASLFECMQSEGYRFVPRRGDAQAQDCWTAIESASAMPRAYCFEKAPKETP
jgi:hypothetical protein